MSKLVEIVSTVGRQGEYICGFLHPVTSLWQLCCSDTICLASFKCPDASTERLS